MLVINVIEALLYIKIKMYQASKLIWHHEICMGSFRHSITKNIRHNKASP